MKRPSTETDTGPSPPGERQAAALDGFFDNSALPAWFMPVILALTDLCVLLCVWTCSVLLRHALGGVFAPADYAPLAPLALIHLLLNAFLGSYDIMASPPLELKKCTLGTLLFVLIFTSMTFWVHSPYPYSRGILLMGGLQLLVAIPFGRIFMRAWCSRFSWWGYKALVYIHRESSAKQLKAVLRNVSTNLRPAAVILHEPGAVRLPRSAIPFLSGPDCLQTSRRKRPDAVFIFLTRGELGPEGTAILAKAEGMFGRIIILNQDLRLGNLWARPVDIGTMMGLQVVQRLLDPKRLLLKTATDLVIAALLLLLLLPLLAAIMLVIRLEGRGPLLYRHQRVGRGGVPFFALKFRTMRPDSDGLLETVLNRDERLRQLWEEHRKLPDDPRITRVGRFLRRSSLDELPQLFNVLRGEMSLIGPRPIMAEEIPHYRGRFQFVNQVRPGLTGFWQVSGRNKLPYPERVEHDIYYIKNWSFWLDMYILLKTPAALLDHTGTA